MRIPLSSTIENSYSELASIVGLSSFHLETLVNVTVGAVAPVVNLPAYSFTIADEPDCTSAALFIVTVVPFHAVENT